MDANVAPPAAAIAPAAAPAAAAPVAAPVAATTALSDSQRAEFKRLFDLKFPEAQSSNHSLFSAEKYSKVVHCLNFWDGWSHATKRAESGGNGHRWVKEFKLHHIGGAEPVLIEYPCANGWRYRIPVHERMCARMGVWL